MFLYEVCGWRYESSCSHLNLRYRVCFNQGVPWHSGNYRVWIHSETRTWYDKNIQLQYTVYLLTISLIHFLCIVRLTIYEKCGFVSKNTWNYQTETVVSGRSVKNCVLKIFPKLTEKRLSRSLFFIKSEERKASTLSKGDFGRDVFL